MKCWIAEHEAMKCILLVSSPFEGRCGTLHFSLSRFLLLTRYYAAEARKKKASLFNMQSIVSLVVAPGQVQRVDGVALDCRLEYT